MKNTRWKFFNFEKIYKSQILVLVIGFSISIWAFEQLHKGVISTERERFEKRVEDQTTNIVHQFNFYAEALEAGASLYAASSEVSLENWKTFLNRYQIISKRPGINGIGVIWPIKNEDSDTFSQKMSKIVGGEFKIKNVPKVDPPAVPYAEKYIISFIEPFENNRAARGLDVGSELNRRYAAELARDTGYPSITKKITLVQATKSGPGFLMFVPMYHSAKIPEDIETRRKLFKGWVYAPFVTGSFMSNALIGSQTEFCLALFEEGDMAFESKLFSNCDGSANIQQFEKVTSLRLGQKEFILGWNRRVPITLLFDYKSVLVLVIGGLSSILMALLIGNLETTNQRAQEIANDKTAALLTQHRLNHLLQLIDQALATSQSKSVLLDNVMNAILSDERFKVVCYWETNMETGDFSRRSVFQKSAMPADALSRFLAKVTEFAETPSRLDPITSDVSILIKDQLKFGDDVFSELSGVVALPLQLGDGLVATLEILSDESLDFLKFHEQELIAVGMRINLAIKRIRAEQDLIEARERAERATEAKSEFLSTMSHEIRTPLNGVIGLTEILMDSKLSNEQFELARSISQSGKSLLGIINDVLDFSKIESGKLELEQSEFDIVAYVDDLLKPLQFIAQNKGLEFVVPQHNYNYKVIGDAGRIGQVINNLVSNAIKFTLKGSVRIFLNIEPRNADAYLAFSVVDTGIGIADNAKHRIFKEFSQADQSTSRKFGGTGLGLAISKRLIEKMGGELTFNSQLNVGSTFGFAIKLRNGSKLDMPASKGLMRHEDQQAVHLARILVAEDNLVNQKVISRYLEKLGYRHLLVANGEEVIAALKESKFDLILMDCQMPVLDGYETTERIRLTAWEYQNIPIIALTANAFKEDEHRCMRVGMNAYLTKPINFSVLKVALDRFTQSGTVDSAESESA